MALTPFPPAMRRLIHELTKLPTIGEKSAARLAYNLLMRDESESKALAEAICEAREKTKFCEICFALCEESPCRFCSDSHRDRSVICVVEKPADVLVVERSGGYRGLYHVLQGLWSPLRGVGPERTRIGELFKRLQQGQEADAESPVLEVVLATGATVEGDATAMYIARTVSEMGIKATRIAQGLPKGGELEFADEITLSHAMQGRRSIGGAD